MNCLTLTTKQRLMLEKIPTDWANTSTSPANPTLKQLEKRGLIELRVDPTVHPNQAMMNTFLNDHSHWQVRRK